MLISINHWRIHRFPINHRFLKSLASLFLANPTTSAAAVAKFEDNEPSTTSLSPQNDVLSLILSALNTHGAANFLGGNRFKSLVLTLDSPQIERILYCLRKENPNCAIQFFDLLRDEFGFRHSRVSVFVVAHLLGSWKGQRKALLLLIQQMVQQEGTFLH